MKPNFVINLSELWHPLMKTLGHLNICEEKKH